MKLAKRLDKLISLGKCSSPFFQISLLTILFATCFSSGHSSENDTNYQDLRGPELIAIQKQAEQLFDELSENILRRNYNGFTAECDEDKIKITASFNSKFKGRIYTVDYEDDPECGTVLANGTLENVTFSLPLGQCGVRMTVLNNNLQNDLRHTVGLYIQYSAILQQVIDDKLTVSCVEIKKPPVEMENITNSIGLIVQPRRSRQGRRFRDKEANLKVGYPKNPKIGEAWMEILNGKDPSPKTKNGLPVQVGEDVTLVVSTKVTRGYDARVVNCTAHDGSRTTSDGSRVQPILDSAGCSIDRGLVPNFRRRRLPVESRSQMTLHFATFPAFKFPERDHIHVRCTVAYCQGPCPQESCDSGKNHFGSWKDKYGRVADILVDTSDIVNAVEVLSPEMDGGGGHYERHQSSHSPGVGSASEAAPRSLQFSDTPHQQPVLPQQPSLLQQQQQQQQQSYGNGHPPPLNSNYYYSPHAINGQPIYANNQIPQGTQTPPTVCISPGTVILALVILGIVLVISATATLWLALKRSEAKKYEEQKISPFNTSPTPSPYYRFNHW